MLPPVFPILNTPEIRSYVGTSPVRIYDFGSAPQDALKPYITFQDVAGSPHDQLSGAPCGDADLVQIDIYAGPEESQKAIIRTLAKHVQSALDNAYITNRLVIQTRETDTKLFRISIEANFITNR